MPDPTSGNEHHAHQFQELYHKSLKALIETIAAALRKSAELNIHEKTTQQDLKGAIEKGRALKSELSDGLTEQPIRLFVGGKEVYSQVSGQEPTKNFITLEQFQQIKQALEAPPHLKETVEIKAGTKRVFYAKDGQIKLDKLGLAQSPVQSALATQTAESLKESKLSIQTIPHSSDPELKAETNLLQMLEQQGQRIEALEKKLDALSQSLNSVQNKSLSRWMGSMLSNTAGGFKQAVSGWAVRATEAINSVQLHVQSAFLSQHPLQKQLQNVENKVGGISAKFDQGMDSIQSQLATIQQQLKTVRNSSTMQPNIETAVKEVVEPVLVSSEQRDGIALNVEALQAKEGLHDRVEHIELAHKPFKAGMVVSAAEKLLQRIPSETSNGDRAFETGSGYRFHTDGSTTTIYAPDHSELVRSSGQGNNQITVSPHLTLESADKLEAIGDKIHQDLAPVQQSNQSFSQSRGYAPLI